MPITTSTNHWIIHSPIVIVTIVLLMFTGERIKNISRFMLAYSIVATVLKVTSALCDITYTKNLYAEIEFLMAYYSVLPLTAIVWWFSGEKVKYLRYIYYCHVYTQALDSGILYDIAQHIIKFILEYIMMVAFGPFYIFIESCILIYYTFVI
jgi:hypothetical protein